MATRESSFDVSKLQNGTTNHAFNSPLGFSYTLQTVLEARKFVRYTEENIFSQLNPFRHQCASSNYVCNQDGKWPLPGRHNIRFSTLAILGFCQINDYGAHVGSLDPNSAVSQIACKSSYLSADFFIEKHYHHFLLVSTELLSIQIARTLISISNITRYWTVVYKFSKPRDLYHWGRC